MTESKVPQDLQFDSFEEFYPFYLSQHSKPATRYVHCAGTALAVANLAKSVAFGPRRQALLSPAIGYGFAWFSHFVIEKNKPATFGYPAYSIRGDFQMLYDMARGRNSELQQIADEQKAVLESLVHAQDASSAMAEAHPQHSEHHPHAND